MIETRSKAPRAEAVINLLALRHNIQRLRELVTAGLDGRWALPEEQTPPQLMVVVKADGYGHGAVQVGKVAREAGADWLGVATPEEALRVRTAGDTGRVMCWLSTLGDDLGPVIAADVDVSAYTVEQLRLIAATSKRLRRRARVQLKVDTGLSRGGATHADWHALLAEAVLAERDRSIVVTGLWSHMASTDEPRHPANDAQEREFRAAVAAAEEAGLRPEVRHLANSAGALFHPSIRFDLVRLGIATYGLSPAPDLASSPELGLVPVMTLRGRIVMGKVLQPGAGVSYGHTFETNEETAVALVPMGYGDGVPRHASSRAQVEMNGNRCDILGRICMDQFVVAGEADLGDEVVLFGPGTGGEPTAQDWADWCETISYEIVTRIGGRVQRRWVGA